MRKWPTGWRACVAAMGLVIGGGAVLLLPMYLLGRARFAPRHIQTLDLIEQRTGWLFPPGTRIISAGHDNLGMDFAIWAVLEVPREKVRDVLLAEAGAEVTHEEGSGKLPEMCAHLRWGHWDLAPEWLPPLPQQFQHYVAVRRFGPGYDDREAVAELGGDDQTVATVYVFYTTTF